MIIKNIMISAEDKTMKLEVADSDMEANEKEEAVSVLINKTLEKLVKKIMED